MSSSLLNVKRFDLNLGQYRGAFVAALAGWYDAVTGRHFGDGDLDVADLRTIADRLKEGECMVVTHVSFDLGPRAMAGDLVEAAQFIVRPGVIYAADSPEFVVDKGAWAHFNFVPEVLSVDEVRALIARVSR